MVPSDEDHLEKRRRMYATYWGLTDSPFRNTLDPRWFHEGPLHEEALARLLYLVEERRRFGLLAGPPGTGKSLLLGVLARQLRRTQRRLAIVDLGGLHADEVLWQLAVALHAAPRDSDAPVRLWRALGDQLQALRMARTRTVVLVDQFDRAASDCIQVIERLLHLDDGPAPTLTLIAGLRTANLPWAATALAELSDLRIELGPFDLDGTADYVHDLAQKAGARRRLFDDGALDALFDHAQGVPRQINRLCDLALLAAMGEGRSVVDAAVMETAAAELPAGAVTGSVPAFQRPSRAAG